MIFSSNQSLNLLTNLIILYNQYLDLFFMIHSNTSSPSPSLCPPFQIYPYKYLQRNPKKHFISILTIHLSLSLSLSLEPIPFQVPTACNSPDEMVVIIDYSYMDAVLLYKGKRNYHYDQMCRCPCSSHMMDINHGMAQNQNSHMPIPTSSTHYHFSLL